jgi:hypothetical protein
MRVERHRLPAIERIETIVLPAERDDAVVGGNEPAVGNRDAMGITGDISQDGLGPGGWLLA